MLKGGKALLPLSQSVHMYKHWTNVILGIRGVAYSTNLILLWAASYAIVVKCWKDLLTIWVFSPLKTIHFLSSWCEITWYLESFFYPWSIIFLFIEFKVNECFFCNKMNILSIYRYMCNCTFHSSTYKRLDNIFFVLISTGRCDAVFHDHGCGSWRDNPSYLLRCANQNRGARDVSHWRRRPDSPFRGHLSSGALQPRFCRVIPYFSQSTIEWSQLSGREQRFFLN